MRKYPENTDNKYTSQECVEITKKHRKSVMNVMDIFYNKLKKLWKEHDQDKEIPENLEKYTYLLNHPEEKEAKNERKKIHNHNNTHHIEWFLKCDKPKLQHLVEMVCDNVATAIARNAKYEDIFKENKERYMQKWLSEELTTICTNTFIDLWDSMHQNN